MFVLSGPDAGRRFLTALPDLLELGLTEATLLHLLSASRGPAEPMPDLANWVRHFEASVPRVELALKRGDPMRWICDLARLHQVELVVLDGGTAEATRVFERASSRLRVLGVAALFLPAGRRRLTLLERVLIAVGSPTTADRAAPGLVRLLRDRGFTAVHVLHNGDPRPTAAAGVPITYIESINGIAETLLAYLAERRATLLVLPIDEPGADDAPGSAAAIVQPLLESVTCPVLIWPGMGTESG